MYAWLILYIVRQQRPQCPLEYHGVLRFSDAGLRVVWCVVWRVAGAHLYGMHHHHHHHTRVCALFPR